MEKVATFTRAFEVYEAQDPEPGWWFFDLAGRVYGPFSTRAKAQANSNFEQRGEWQRRQDWAYRMEIAS